MSPYGKALQKEILEFMKFVFPSPPHCSRMHADMIRVAIGGAFSQQKVVIESITNIAMKQKLASIMLQITDDFRYTTDPNWKPGKDWQWWTTPNPEMN